MPTTKRHSDMQDVFDEMTQAIVDRKAGTAKSAGLTPIGFERGAHVLGTHPPESRPIPVRVPAPFPNDHPAEVVASAVAEIRLQMGYIVAALDAIDSTVGDREPAVSAPAEDPVKVQEREADARAAARTPFDESMAAKMAAAQAATFTDARPDIGWQCPMHGDEALHDTKSKRGRPYVECTVPDCGQFQK